MIDELRRARDSIKGLLDIIEGSIKDEVAEATIALAKDWVKEADNYLGSVYDFCMNSPTEPSIPKVLELETSFKPGEVDKVKDK